MHNSDPLYFAKLAREIREPHCPHGRDDGTYCSIGRCTVVEAPTRMLREVAARDPLPGTLGETAKRYALAELDRRKAAGSA